MAESRVHSIDRAELDRLYAHFNHRRFVHPDPLEFLYDYPDVADREIVALVAASLAYGRVAQILASVTRVLRPMAPSPVRFLASASLPTLRKTYAGFVHRFARGDHMASLLFNTAQVVHRFGSLHDCFLSGLKPGAHEILPALACFAGHLTNGGALNPGHLIPNPERKSACKRLNLFLRWMVRMDTIDPGGWENVSPSLLIVPLDTHMHRVGLRLGFTTRRQADMRTACEITHGFKRLRPDDPVRYDFALTRLGIRKDVAVPSWAKGV